MTDTNSAGGSLSHRERVGVRATTDGRRPRKEALPRAFLTSVRHLRREQSPIERNLWALLRSRQINGLKFRRQHPIGQYIADFYCDAHRLVIEIDGDTHAQQQDYDRERTQWLKGQGYQIIRFTNSEVMTNQDGVLQVIMEACSRIGTPSPQPSPGGRGSQIQPSPHSLRSGPTAGGRG